MKISILGAGRWASCIAYCMDRKKYNVLMWERLHEDKSENELFTTRANQYVKLTKRVYYTHDLEKTLNYGDVVIISILSQQLDDLMSKVKKIKGYQNKKYCIAMKGIEASTGRRLSQILIDNGVKKNNIAVWVGPGHVQSFVSGQPTNMIISAYNRTYARTLVDSFTNPGLVDMTLSHDIIGSEIGAAAKNVIGIAAGILEGSGYEQKKGPLMPASVKEIGKFISSMGGNPDTASGLAFLGDFQATLFDHNSKNLTYGRTIVQKKTVNENILNEFIDVKSVEGIKTAEALLLLNNQYNSEVEVSKQVKMPITTAVNDIVNKRIDIRHAGDYISEKITEALEL